MKSQAIAIGYAAQSQHAYTIVLGPIMAFSKTPPTARAVATKEHEFVLAVGDSVARTTMTHQEFNAVRAVIERCLTPAFVEAMQFEARRGAEVEETAARSDFRSMCSDHQKMVDAFHEIYGSKGFDLSANTCDTNPPLIHYLNENTQLVWEAHQEAWGAARKAESIACAEAVESCVWQSWAEVGDERKVFSEAIRGREQDAQQTQGGD